MPRNGSGTFSLVAGNPVVTGTVISSTVQNNTMNDIATALTQSISSTGVTTPSANLPMGGFRHTGVGNATALSQYASVQDVQNGSLVTLSAVGGTADAITATAPLLVASYAAGQRFQFAATATNTGAVTINLNAIGAKSITKSGTTALSAGDIASGQVVEIVYDGTRFQMIGARQAGTVAAVTVNTRSSDTVFAVGDLGSMNRYTGTFTQTFGAAATLGSGWYVDVQNVGTGVITFDANGAETFNTQSGARTTIAMYPGEGFRIVCNGTGFDLVGRSAMVMLERQAASGAAVDIEKGFTDTEFSKVEIVLADVDVGSSQLSIRLKKSGSYITTGYGYGISYTDGSAAVTNTGQASAAISVANNAINASGTLQIVNPKTTSGRQQVIGDISDPTTGSPLYVRSMSGVVETTAAAIEGVRFFGGTTPGTITSGIFSSYGIRG